MVRKRWHHQAERKKICEEGGIPCGFQQGVTLGHGSIYDPAGGGELVLSLPKLPARQVGTLFL